MVKMMVDEFLVDEIAVSVGRAVGEANKLLPKLKVDPFLCVISITQYTLEKRPVWRIVYSPRERAKSDVGDVVIDVDMLDGAIKNITRD